MITSFERQSRGVGRFPCVDRPRLCAAVFIAAAAMAAVWPASSESAIGQDDRRGIFNDCDTSAVPVGQLVLATRGAEFTFGSSDIPAIPAEFFDPGSLPFEGTIPLKAAPPSPDITNADMSINRRETAFVGAQGSSDVVDIELVQLNLVSVEPITVNVGTDTQQWHVEVGLPVTRQPVQADGMTINRTLIEGGTFDAVLPVCPLFTFVRESDGETRTLTHCKESPPIVFQVFNGQWEFEFPEPEPDPSDCMYLPPAEIIAWISGDVDSPSIIQSVQAIGFVDCNQNTVNDTVDILDGASFDVNGNGVPDECECPGDVGGASPGGVDINDLLAVLGAWGDCPDPCPPVCREDVNADCTVDINDLLLVLANWGSCPN